jgi:hypothetical protein
VLYEQVMAIFIELDPAQLLAQGYPPVEYDPEVDDFANLLGKKKALTPKQVYDVLEKWFGPGSEQFIPAERHVQLADRLNALLTKAP